MKAFLLQGMGFFSENQHGCDGQLQCDRENRKHLKYVRNAYCSYANHVWRLQAPNWNRKLNNSYNGYQMLKAKIASEHQRLVKGQNITCMHCFVSLWVVSELKWPELAQIKSITRKSKADTIFVGQTTVNTLQFSEWISDAWLDRNNIPEIFQVFTVFPVTL